MADWRYGWPHQFQSMANIFPFKTVGTKFPDVAMRFIVQASRAHQGGRHQTHKHGKAASSPGEQSRTRQIFRHKHGITAQHLPFLSRRNKPIDTVKRLPMLPPSLPQRLQLCPQFWKQSLGPCFRLLFILIATSGVEKGANPIKPHPKHQELAP